MLPLGTETGRHIRNDNEKSVNSDAAKGQLAKSVAQFVGHLDTSYAMLPLGAETGRHIRNLTDDNKEPEKSVAVNAPKATA
jgi:hypothetical protein